MAKCTVQNRYVAFSLALILAALLGPAAAAQNAARQRQLLDAGWRFHRNELDGSSSLTPGGTPLTQWVWMADDNAPNDAATMAAPGLDTSAWTNVTPGTDVFNGRVGYAWFRAAIGPLASSVRPLTLHFLGVDDNAAVYLNGTLLGQHSGWSEPFDITLDPAWSSGGSNLLAVAVQNTAGMGGIIGSVLLQSGLEFPPPGVPVTQWVWTADDHAPNDAAAMAAPGLDVSTWTNTTVGQDVFNGRTGSVWFRATLDALVSSGRPLTLHFMSVDDNASVFLNGALIGRHAGGSQPFDISPLDSAWIVGGPNVLAVAVENSGGPGGILGSVFLQSGQDNPSLSVTGPGFDDSAWRSVHLPHDYVVEGTFTNTADASHGSLPLTTAWYRKTFFLPTSAQGKSLWIDFDGVYHNAMVWLNGQYLGKWHSGYAGFRYNISRCAVYGGTNVLAVHVDPQGSEGWWYEGGGIYRHVWLNIAANLHVAPWGTFVASTVQGPDTNGNASAVLTITTTLTNAAASAQSCVLISQVSGPDGVVAGTAATPLTVLAGTATNVVQTVAVANARLWSIETPQLYQLHTTVQADNQTVDDCDTAFGIRSLRYDVGQGFFLNGKPVKLNGTCNHQDFAGVGIAMPDTLLYWRIKKLKEMGSNAYRCSHNPPTEALLDACDRLGMVVMDETRHLGDATGQKSDASTPYSDLSELNTMILRDRNHPSIIMWSMCNEEFAVQGTQAGADMFYAMQTRVGQFDTTRPITSAMNGDWGTGISLVEDLQGCNYNPGGYDGFHQSFPSQPMFASETTSATIDRGVYTNDSAGSYVSSYNTTAENSWQPVGTRAFVAGGFVWTGFDYKGEPSPYGWPCVNSHFGIMDMCGLPKDSYYYYQAWWGSQPLAYIFPHWNWPTPGQTVPVWCFANTETVELFLNGVSQGVQTMPPYGHVAWSVPYTPGTLLVKGYTGGNLVASNQVTTTGTPASLSLTTDRSTLSADGEDLTVIYAAVLDAQGRVVPTATNLVSFNLSGAGYVAGVGNGDPSSHEPDKAAQRHAFNGWCMALVGATDAAGPVTLTATSPGLASASLALQSSATNSLPVAPLGLAATPGNGQASLRWPLSFGATSYNIKRATVSGGPYVTVANYTAISFTDTSVANASTYYYVVSAVNANGESANSAEVSVTPVAPSTPPVPGSLTATRDDAQVNLSWSASVGATSYNIKRATASKGPFTTFASATSNSYADTGLTNGTTYYYVVSAVNAGLESANSVPASATPASMSLLVGTIIGTTGSWNNSGNTRELAMDGNPATFFDAATGDGDWVGLDLGTNISKVISKIRYCPRSGYASRMAGGMFQGANLADFSDAVTLFTLTTTPPDGTMTSQTVTNTSSFRYVRYLAPASGFGNVAEVEFYSLGPHISRLSGPIIGTAGSWNNSGNTKEKAMDGNLTTYFDAPTGDGDWVGLDLGSAKVITSVRYFPRSSFAGRMAGGMFQGANAADFSDAVTWFTIAGTPPDATMTAQIITNSNGFRYVRYLSPPGGYGNVAEVQFFSSTPGLPTPPASPAAPVGLAATPGNAQVLLSWTGSSGATNYNLKRALVSGGPYALVRGSTANVCMDSGLAAGTYYYVVSAVNAGGESANSAEASATLGCSLPAAPTGLAATAEYGQLMLVWSPAPGATSYNLLRATNSAGPYTPLAVGLTTTSFSDTPPSSTPALYYIVQAVNSCGPSAGSTPLGITPLPQPELGLILQGKHLQFSWPGWAGGYELYWTSDLAAQIPWQPVTNAVQKSNGISTLILPATNASQQFFRLGWP